MQARIAALVLCVAVLGTPHQARAVNVPGPFRPVRASTPFTLDGSLGDARWSSAPRAIGFTDATSRTEGRSRTSAALYYDDKNLYVAFWCDQTEPITSLQTTDTIGFGTDDFVGFGIDPSGNADRAYYFEITPNGTRYQQASENARYLPQWRGQIKLHAGGWTALMVIPLDALRLPASKVQTWRLNFVRFVARDTQRLTWGYNGQMDNGSGFPDLTDARYWPTIPGVQMAGRAFHPRAGVSVYALTASGNGRTEFVAPNGTLFQQNPRSTGLDLVYPVTPTMSFVGALNPDFSNVDVDQLTITPQVFPRNLTEYRPFFAQGANYINNSATALGINESPNLTFYSPSINTFDRGFKLEGTYGMYESLGLLEARGTDQNSLQPFDDIAFGWKHVLPSRTFGYWTNGVIVNDGDIHDSTVEVGVQARDLRTGWVGALFHEQEMGTLVTDPAQGLSTYGFIDHQGPTHEAILAYRDIGALYNPFNGYTVTSDIRGPGASYSIFGSGPPNSPIINGNIYVFGDRYQDLSGAVHRADAGFSAFANMKGNYSISLGTTQDEFRTYGDNSITGYPFYLDGLTQRYDQTYINLGLRPNSPSPINLGYSWGPFSNYYLQQFTSNATRPIGKGLTLSLEIDGTHEQLFDGPVNGQWLRRVSLGWSVDRSTTLALALRDISGTGGFAVPGTNFSASLHTLYAGGNELYLSFGTPAANQTINRFLIKYVFKSHSQQ